MTLRQTLEVLEILDSATACGRAVVELLGRRGADQKDVEVTRVDGDRGSTDFVKVVLPGRTGFRSGGPAPTLGVVGRLGGIGARPEVVGLVSDADGAAVALAAAAKLLDMRRSGDQLAGDVIVTTHICPSAPIEPHDPVAFMGSPVGVRSMNEHEVDPRMEAILSVDTTKGNRIINWRGIAITPTVKEGWLLRVAEDLLDLLAIVTGAPPRVIPVTMQDLTPYGNGVYHLNSILQPSLVTTAPVVGLATTAVTSIPGPASGASHEVDIAAAARFVVEVAKGFTAGRTAFYDPEEFGRLVDLYGPGPWAGDRRGS